MNGEDKVACPHCGEEVQLEVEYGYGQIMPADCTSCGAREFYDSTDAIMACDVEAFVGWHLGQDMDPFDSLANPSMTDAARVRINERREKLILERDYNQAAELVRQSELAEKHRIEAERKTRYSCDLIF